MLVFFIRLITEKKWKQHCGARRPDFGLRRRSPKLTFRVVCERDCDAQRYFTWQGEDISLRENIPGALHHHRQMGLASPPALALFSQEIRLPIASANEILLARSALTRAKLHRDPQGTALKLAEE